MIVNRKAQLLKESCYAYRYENEIKRIFQLVKNCLKNNEMSFDDQIDGINAHFNVRISEKDSTFDFKHGAPVFNLNFTTGSDDEIYQTLRHEITHFFDMRFAEQQGRKMQRHSYSGLDTHIDNDDVKDILYGLWDNTEFNAFQANITYAKLVNFKNQTEKILDELENDWSFTTWNEIKEYFEDSLNPQFWENKSLEYVKKYFLATTRKLLKKFIRKSAKLI